VSSTARVITMQSARPIDENSFDEPRRIVPVETTLTGVGPAFTQSLPAYSLTIVRVGARP
jgi:alpha-L-arabinofuranosidase